MGIGDKKFDFLEELDGDYDPIKDSNGQVAARDIVQFVNLKDFADKSSVELRKHTLREVPIQFVGYVDVNGLQPRPVNAFTLERDASNAYLDDDGDDLLNTPRHVKGDTAFMITETEMNEESDDDDDEKEGDDGGGLTPKSAANDPMAHVPLPPFWEKNETADGRVFYINHRTKTTQWEHPLKDEVTQQRTTQQQVCNILN